MKMPKLKDLIPGKHGDQEIAPDLRDQMQKDAAVKLEIIAAINEFDQPIEITVFMATGNFSMRNISFWKALHDKDADVKDYLTEVLSWKR